MNRMVEWPKEWSHHDYIIMKAALIILVFSSLVVRPAHVFPESYRLIQKSESLQSSKQKPGHPIVEMEADYLVGGSKGAKWIDTENLAKTIKGGERYRIYGFDSYLGNGLGAKPVKSEPLCTDTILVKVTRSSTSVRRKIAVMAVAGEWNALPRVPRFVVTPDASVREAVARILIRNGIRQPTVNISQVIHVDLDGDGVDEVLVCAGRHDGRPVTPTSHVSPHITPGDYSLVLLRKRIKGRLKDIVISGEYFPKSKEAFGGPTVDCIRAVLDLNGDGNMEIILKYRYFEGEGISIFDLTKSNNRAVLSVGCGA